MVHSQDMCGRILRVKFSKFIYDKTLSSLKVFRFLVIYKISDFRNRIILLCSGGGFNISPLKRRNGRPRTQVQHLMQIDLKGWGVGYVSSFQQHCLLQMLNSVAGEFL